MREKLILMLVFVVLLASCAKEAEETTNIVEEIAEEPVKEQVQVKAEPKSATINIINSQFVPAVLNVKAGTQVTWKNTDGIKHLIISDSDEFFDSTTMDQNQRHTYVFDTPGEHRYHDGFKPLVKGKIIVS